MAQFVSENIKKILFSLGVVLALLAAVFLPEILGLKSWKPEVSLDFLGIDNVNNSIQPEIDQAAVRVAKNGKRPDRASRRIERLERVESAVDEGYSDSGKEERAVQKVALSAPIDLNFILKSEPPKRGQRLQEIQYFLRDGGYYELLRVRQFGSSAAARRADKLGAWDAVSGWPYQREGEFVAKLEEAEQLSLDLMSQIPSEDRAAFSLATFVSAIRFVMDEGDRHFSPQQAAKYLVGLGDQVERDLADSSTGAKFRRDWQALRLSESFNGVLNQEKAPILKPFDPKLQLFSVNIRQMGEANGKFNPVIIPTIEIQGFVRDESAMKVTLLRAGVEIGSQDLPPQLDPDGMKRFFLRSHDARGTLELRVTSKDGQQRSRHYSFYPRVRGFQWQGDQYVLPFRNGDVDPRLDKFFSVGLSRDKRFFDNRGIGSF